MRIVGTIVFLLLASVGAFAQPRPLLTLPVTHAAIMGDPRVMFAATASGLFRSTDDGSNWRSMAVRPRGERQPSFYLLMPHPSAARTLFATTDASDGALWKTTDNGETWVAANKGLPQSGPVLDQLFFPNSSGFNLMYARIGAEIYKSIDGADSWTLQGVLPSTQVRGTLEINPRDPTYMFFAFSTGIYRSTAEGAAGSWSLFPSVSIPPGAGIQSMLMDPFVDNVTYVGVAGINSQNQEVGGFYISTVSGTNSAEAGLALLDGRLRPQFIASPRARPLRLFTTESPCVTRTSVVTCVGKSVDASASGGRSAGRSWTFPIIANVNGTARLGFHPQNPDVMIAAIKSGVAVSSDGGDTWLPRVGFVVPTLTALPPVEFRLPPGGTGRLDVPLRIVESTEWNLPVSSTVSGAPWLTVTGANGTTPLNIGIRVSAEGIEPGTYTASVRFASPNAANDGMTLPIRLVVAPIPESKVSYVTTTFAGTGQSGNFGDNGQATRAIIGSPDSLALDVNGNLYLSQPTNHVVRVIAPNGRITRFAGNGQAGFAGDGGQSLLASLFTPRGLAANNNAIFVADSDNQKLRQISPDGGAINTVSEIDRPRGIAVDNGGTLYVAIPSLHVVARVGADRKPVVIAGTLRQSGYRGDGGPATGALLAAPADVALGPDGTLYIADTENHRIRAVGDDGRIRTVAGLGLPGFFGDSPDARLSALNRPAGVAVDSAGVIYISDTDNQLVRRVLTDGSIETIAGSGQAGFSGDDGPALSAQFRQPTDLVVDPQGAVYVVDSQNLRIRLLTPKVRATGPVISENGISSLADRSARLAPGSLFTLTGVNLASEEAVSNETPWPLLIGGTYVTFGGVPAALTLVSPTQINGQIPWDAPTGAVDVAVTANDVAGRPLPVNLAAFAPSILTGPGNRAIAVNEDGSANSASAPAAPGSLVTIYLTGVGPLVSPIATGGAAAEDPLSIPLEAPQVIVNRDSVEPLEYRMVPGRVGVAQVQFRVPLLAVGDHPVRVTIGGASSASPVISVR